MKHIQNKRQQYGFSLLELMIVITIIALLSALTITGFSYAQTYSARSRTQSYMSALKAGLEKYKEKWGEYPEPANPSDSQEIPEGSGNSFQVGGAKMLYQALTGDGYDAINLPSQPTDPDLSSESNGTINKAKAAAAVMTDLPKPMIMIVGGAYMLVDGFNHPFQYEKTIAGANGAGGTTLNPNYDLWSYGNAAQAEMDNSLKGQQAQNGSGGEPLSWIKNW